MKKQVMVMDVPIIFAYAFPWEKFPELTKTEKFLNAYELDM